MKGHRSKKASLRLIHGDDVAQFKKLFMYKAELERTNPGSTVIIDYDGLTFTKMYVCLAALNNGFKVGCRKVVAVDGCFLKGVPGWQLLTVVSIDGDDSMYPIAWAVVETECNQTWGWFMSLVAADLAIDNSLNWTFMSDKQKVCSVKLLLLIR
ncbi:hypothetical protein LINPERHAP1_LOCUS8860 [Linum perenne]